ncbi:hypothetical protein ACU4HD_47850 [Cupriavidus basilensis]
MATALFGNLYPGVPLDEDGKPLARKEEAAKDVYSQASVIVTRGKRFDVSKAMLVSVPDAVGATHEAAQLRLELPQAAKENPDSEKRLLEAAISDEHQGVEWSCSTRSIRIWVTRQDCTASHICHGRSLTI